MNIKLYFVAIIVLLIPVIYAGLGVLGMIHSVLGN